MTSKETGKRDVYVLGSGGHAKVVLDCLLASGHEVTGYIQPHKSEDHPFADLSYVGSDDKLEELPPEESVLVNGIGSVPGKSDLRLQVFEQGLKRGHSFLNVIHPSAVVSDAVLGDGIQIMAGVVVQPGTQIGRNVIINTRASVDHDCVVGDHVHVAPGVVLSGGVTIGHGSHIGTGAAVIQGIHIGTDAVIGAGAVVTCDVPDGATVYPARSTIKEANDS